VNIEKVYKNIDFKYTIYVCMNIDLCVHMMYVCIYMYILYIRRAMHVCIHMHI